MKIIDFQKKKQEKNNVGIATKMDYLIRKVTQFIIDHDIATGNINTLEDIQKRTNAILDEKIKTLDDINKLYEKASRKVVVCK